MCLMQFHLPLKQLHGHELKQERIVGKAIQAVTAEEASCDMEGICGVLGTGLTYWHMLPSVRTGIKDSPGPDFPADGAEVSPIVRGNPTSVGVIGPLPSPRALECGDKFNSVRQPDGNFLVNKKPIVVELPREHWPYPIMLPIAPAVCEVTPEPTPPPEET